MQQATGAPRPECRLLRRGFGARQPDRTRPEQPAADRTDDRKGNFTGNFTGNFARRPREFHQRHRARRRVSSLHEGRRHIAGLRHQSWHYPALSAGSRRQRSMRLRPAGTFGHRDVSPTRHRPAGAHDVPPPQTFTWIFSRRRLPAAIAGWRPSCHRRIVGPGCRHDDGEARRGAQQYEPRPLHVRAERSTRPSSPGSAAAFRPAPSSTRF